MARQATWQDIARLSRRVDRHDKDIGELLEMSQDDHKTLVLHGRELELLRRLSEVQADRITHVAASVARLRRSRRGGR